MQLGAKKKTSQINAATRNTHNKKFIIMVFTDFVTGKKLLPNIRYIKY